MGRHRLWWLALPLVAGGWLSARWLDHLLHGSDAHQASMAATGHGALHLCGACVLVLVLLAVLALGRPLLRLGFHHGLPLVSARAPRPALTRSRPLRLVFVGPVLPRPSIFACGRVVRAPPFAPMPA